MLTPEQERLIRVAIADDDKVFRKGVIFYLRQNAAIKFVKEASEGKDLLENLHQTNPDVILMGLKMPVKDDMGNVKIY